MLRNTTHPGAFGESVCCKIQCNSINKRDIFSILYLLGWKRYHEDRSRLTVHVRRKEKKEDTGLNLAVTDNSIYK